MNEEMPIRKEWLYRKFMCETALQTSLNELAGEGWELFGIDPARARCFGKTEFYLTMFRMVYPEYIKEDPAETHQRAAMALEDTT